MTAPVALSCGEPAGIGPELAVKAWEELDSRVPFFWVGDPSHLPQGTLFREIETPDQAHAVMSEALPVLAHRFNGPLTAGVPNPDHAQHVIDVIARCVDLVQSGQASALCTAPIHKQALQDGAGFAYPGHTEYLASLAGVERSVMMLASDQLRVVPVTIHIAIKDVPSRLTASLLEETLRITHASLQRDFGLENPRIAVAGLNPHAGEGGKMGQEEITLITPVLDRLRAEGLQIVGPSSADTMFHVRARAGYDVALCMYHDQALIPIKTLDFDRGVNVTLGLPFIRTSPDHGTAFDIAGKGLANPTSTIEALKMATDLAKRRNA
ncbi:4-hydroxythreonine-4-phosphate dehydrogenase [Roseovarius albus]|uniref:4-hydroxythreonine-4-phosphate dehydrogenase n=1 Tax=Roseovarius albus TaxID=1247867 RepID=A0A1X6YB92_9RHOB|nr:4-hydroxythreonine-4-phosphate dehydrogenase PdxA [Roseovarius albus]SLN16185.1 4-hydroxythreonine-4-phosphate dehydrogenase [Roseovarius albus]